MANDYGVTFAPTEEQAELAKRRGNDALPEAIRVLSLHMPKFLGARAPVAPSLMGQGGAGADPYLSAVMQSLVKTLAPTPNRAGLPGGTAGYPPLPTQAPPLFPGTDPDPGPGAPPSQPPKTRTHWGPDGPDGSDPYDDGMAQRRGKNNPYGGDGWSRDTL
jgi:hypothetical protein